MLHQEFKVGLGERYRIVGEWVRSGFNCSSLVPIIMSFALCVTWETLWAGSIYTYANVIKGIPDKNSINTLLLKRVTGKRLYYI